MRTPKSNNTKTKPTDLKTSEVFPSPITSPPENGGPLSFKKCSRCLVKKPKNDFHKDKTHPDGLKSSCKECRLAKYKHKYKTDIAYRKASDARSKEWRKDNPEKAKTISKKYRDRNITKERARCRAKSMNRSLRKIEGIEIKEVFPTNCHIDHIVPLQGETVSGLHVPWNLQPMEASKNLSKSNRFDWATYKKWLEDTSQVYHPDGCYPRYSDILEKDGEVKWEQT